MSSVIRKKTDNERVNELVNSCRGIAEVRSSIDFNGRYQSKLDNVSYKTLRDAPHWCANLTDADAGFVDVGEAEK